MNHRCGRRGGDNSYKQAEGTWLVLVVLGDHPGQPTTVMYKMLSLQINLSLQNLGNFISEVPQKI